MTLIINHIGDGYDLKNPVEDLLESCVFDVANGGGFRELRQFQEYFSDYKLIVFDGLNPDRVMFCGNSLSTKKLYYYMIGTMSTII
jgi:hypothetical protein